MSENSSAALPCLHGQRGRPVHPPQFRETKHWTGLDLRSLAVQILLIRPSIRPSFSLVSSAPNPPRIHVFTFSRIHGFTHSWIHGFTDSRFQDSRVQDSGFRETHAFTNRTSPPHHGTPHQALNIHEFSPVLNLSPRRGPAL